MATNIFMKQILCIITVFSFNLHAAADNIPKIPLLPLSEVDQTASFSSPRSPLKRDLETLSNKTLTVYNDLAAKSPRDAAKHKDEIFKELKTELVTSPRSPRWDILRQKIAAALALGFDPEYGQNMDKIILKAVEHQDAEMVCLLVEKGVKTHIDPKISLIARAVPHSLPIMQMLINYKALINIYDESLGCTALHRAIYGDPEYMATLLYYHADVTQHDKDGLTALEKLCIICCIPSEPQPEEYVKKAELLIDFHANAYRFITSNKYRGTCAFELVDITKETIPAAKKLYDLFSQHAPNKLTLSA